jgi:hypothetical protein
VKQNSQIWQIWADSLNRWGIKDLTITLLEALGPLSLLGAQLVYVGQPFIDSFIPKGYLDALANMFENPQEKREFIAFLRQPDQPKSVYPMEGM